MDDDSKKINPNAVLYNIPVYLLKYDRVSGIVSYKTIGSDRVYQCNYYELNSLEGGLEMITNILNSLPGKDDKE